VQGQGGEEEEAAEGGQDPGGEGEEGVLPGHEPEVILIQLILFYAKTGPI